MDNISKDKKIILFDGICNLCNNAVLTIIKHDKRNVFVFAALDSESGKKIIKHLGINTSKIDSIILYEPNITYELKSSAALLIAKELGGFWLISIVFLILPKWFRDFVYDFIAEKRYQWFGKKEQCDLPNSSFKDKFI
ncbi:DCC1-like thiol-disulfide oxidoreductase family protein [Polaribacter sp.]|uniref:thiol-disulfide oxidoreductase DCC family protein n=1 Tax=Polaribacter sp. TaxID=1920175 RepID=UPI0025F451B3|nr:DCC1-like thiol-disulfide oxidoreductase family protein [Polaribacter sp.]